MFKLFKKYLYPSHTQHIQIGQKDFTAIYCSRFIERLLGWRLSAFFPDRQVIVILPHTRWVQHFFGRQSLWVFFLAKDGDVYAQQLLVAGASGYCWQASCAVECLVDHRVQVAQWLATNPLSTQGVRGPFSSVD